MLGRGLHHFDEGGAVKKRLSNLFHEEGWQPEKKVVEEDGVGAEVWSLVDREQGSFWLKVAATFQNEGDFEELRDVLDTNLLSRQKEWHELLLDGGSVTPLSSNKSICYFAYSSPWPMSARDCLYCKEVSISDANQFQLLYWTIRDDDVKPPEKDRVRIDFQAAHYVTKTSETSCVYTYIQRSDAKVHLPDFVLKGIQVGILFGEVNGLRRAVARKPK